MQALTENMMGPFVQQTDERSGYADRNAARVCELTTGGRVRPPRGGSRLAVFTFFAVGAGRWAVG